MTVYIRATVSDDEKQRVKEKQTELKMNESELIRHALKNIGVQIEVEKQRGVSPVNRGNPYGRGGREVAEAIEQHSAAIIKDYINGMSWDDLVSKYPLSRGTIAKLVPKGTRARGVKAKK